MSELIPLRYGWKPSLPDGRDEFWFNYPRVPDPVSPDDDGTGTDYPSEYTIDGMLDIPVRDQGNLGSCTANALSTCLQYTLQQSGREPYEPSRLFIYYLERLREGSVLSDAGAYGRDGFHAIQHVGAPPEDTWPYDISQFTTKPSDEAYAEAKSGKIARYTHARRNWLEVRHLLFKGMPVAFGFSVPQSFESEQCMRDGILHMPGENESYIGGHEVVAYGWKEIEEEVYVRCRNSWGEQVMDHGDFWAPVHFLFGWPGNHGGYADDFRAFRLD